MSKHGTPGSFFNIDVNENTPPHSPTEGTPTSDQSVTDSAKTYSTGQLREDKAYSFNVWKDGTIRPNSLEAAQWLDNHANAIAKRKYAKQLARKQIQLVSELEGEKISASWEVEREVTEGFTFVDQVQGEAIPIEVLEHKKQELEGKI